MSHVKSGYLRRYQRGILLKSWKVQFFVLYDDSTWAWFKKKESKKPSGKIHLKSVCSFLAVGIFTQYVPGKPNLPKDGQDSLLIAAPREAKIDAKIEWVLCGDLEQLRDWMEAITNVLPPPPQHLYQSTAPYHVSAVPCYDPNQTEGNARAPLQQGQPPLQFQSQGQPPPQFQSQGQPPPQFQSQGQHQPLHYPAQPYPQYPQQPGQPSTVVIQQGRTNMGGADFASGMLLGGVLGYGLGWGWGPGFGFGLGHGWGYSHHQTNISNYYSTENTNVTGTNEHYITSDATADEAGNADGTNYINEIGYADGAGYFDPNAYVGIDYDGFGYGNEASVGTFDNSFNTEF